MYGPMARLSLQGQGRMLACHPPVLRGLPAGPRRTVWAAKAINGGAGGGGGDGPDPMLLRLLAGDAASLTSRSPTSAADSSQPSFITLRQGIINPQNPWYSAWWGLLIGAAAFTGIFVPWELGFGDVAHMYDLRSVESWVDLALVGLFMADIAVSHCVAYEADELLVDEPGAIAANYRCRLWLFSAMRLRLACTPSVDARPAS